MYTNLFSITIGNYSINILTLVFSFVVFIVAASYDRKGYVWMIVSWFITPLISYLILILIKSPIYDDFFIFSEARVTKDAECEKFKRKNCFYSKEKFTSLKSKKLMERSMKVLAEQQKQISESLKTRLNDTERNYRIILFDIYTKVIAEKADSI